MATAHDTNQTIGAMAAAHPAIIEIFERLGLDYCCHGDRSLDDSCRAIGIDAADVRREIESLETGEPTSRERNWMHSSMTELADHIEHTHHRYAKAAFARLGTIVPRVVAIHGDAHPELRQVADLITTLSQDMHDHFIREERVLFPWLKRLERQTEIHSGPPWSVKRPISCMEHDHEEVGALFSELRALTTGFQSPPDACESYRAVLDILAALERDTHIHIHKENNILFPAGIRAESGVPQHSTAPGAV